MYSPLAQTTINKQIPKLNLISQIFQVKIQL
jgi:hypothetical protein